MHAQGGSVWAQVQKCVPCLRGPGPGPAAPKWACPSATWHLSNPFPVKVHAVSMRRVVMPPPSPQPRNESAGRRHEEGRSAGQFRPGTPSTATQPVSEKAGCLPAKSPRGPAHTGLHPTASVQPQSDSRPPRAPQAREVPAVASETWTSEALRTAPRRKRKTSLPGQRRASIFQDRLRGVVERGSRPH